jgi:hypothetical protein
METILAYQPTLRPALPTIYGPVEYHQQRALFERMDRIITEAKLDAEFLTLVLKDQGIEATKLTKKSSSRFAAYSFVCLARRMKRSSPLKGSPADCAHEIRASSNAG